MNDKANDKAPDMEFIVFATVTYRGASMVVSATSAAEAREIADRSPDFDIAGAEMSDWQITGAGEA